jgi:hypothetical protein
VRRIEGVADGALPTLGGFALGDIERRTSGDASGQFGGLGGGAAGARVTVGRARASLALTACATGALVRVGVASGVMGMTGRASGEVLEPIPDEVIAVAAQLLRRLRREKEHA